MKKLTIALIAICTLGLAATVVAAPPAKSTILHCGCQWDGLDASMNYEEITISSKSRGHDAHVVGSIDSCYTGDEEVEVGVFEPTFQDFVRNGDDCQLSGPPLGDPIASCDSFDPEPVAGDECGSEVID